MNAVIGSKYDGRRRAISYCAAFLMPFSAVTLLYILTRTAPFGDNTLFVSDAYGQYTAFWSYYHDLFHGSADPFFTFEKTMGGSVSGLYAYYLASPMNLLFALFPKSMIPEALHLTTALKLGLCGLTMGIYVDRERTLPIWQSTLLALSYALCAYNVGYCWSIMWLDGVIMLPLIALGIERLTAGRRYMLYILSLAFAVICSFYIGFMLCIFSVLYWLCCCAKNRSGIRNGIKDSIGRFILSSGAAGGLSAFMLLPAVYALSGGKALPMKALLADMVSERVEQAVGITLSDKAMSIMIFAVPAALALVTVLFSMLAGKGKLSRRAIYISIGCAGAAFVLYDILLSKYILLKLFCGTTDLGQIKNGSPAIYCGMVPLFFALMYFSGKGDKRARIADALLLAVMYISMCSLSVNMIWHGFTQNNSFNYRYAFIVPFLIVRAAGEYMSREEKLESGTKPILCAALIAAAGAAALVISPGFISAVWVVADILAAALLAAVYMLGDKIKKSGRQYFIPAAVFALAFTGCMVNALLTIDSTREVYDHTASEFRQMISDARKSAEVLSGDDSLFRVNKDYSLIGANDPMLAGYNGLSHFSSAEKQTVIEYFRSIGAYTYENIWASGENGLTDSARSLMGVKYTLTKDKDGGVTAAENENALPLGFVCGQQASADVEANEYADPFEYVDAVCDTLFGTEHDLFTPADVEYVSYADAAGRADYLVDTASGDELYMYAPGVPAGAVLFADDVEKYEFSAMGGSTLSLGEPESADDIRLTLVCGENETLPEDIVVCHEDDAVFAEYKKLAARQRCEIECETDSHLAASVSAEKDGLLVLTTPYDEAWHVLVDSEKTELRSAAGIFAAVPVTAGEHTVDMRYIPKGLITGIVISLLALYALVWYYFSRL